MSVAYICAECSSISYVDLESIDCGTTLTCETCKGKTVINLQTIKEYCKLTNVERERASHE